MFNSSEGFIHLLFSNMEDNYYTPEGFSLKFIPFLRYKLILKKYRNIFILNYAKSGSEKDYVIQVVGNDSKDLLLPIKKEGFFNISGFNKKKNDSKILNLEIDELFFSKAEIIDQYFNLLHQGNEYKDNAIVIPIRMFNEFCQDERIYRELENSNKNSTQTFNGNILIITCSLDTNENDLYFRNGNLEYKGSHYSKDSFFFDANLFPDINRAFDNTSGNTEQIVFYYDILKDVFGNRMQIWNNMDYESISLAVKYYYLHNYLENEIIDEDAISSFIWAYYNSGEVRNKYKNTKLPLKRDYSLKRIIKYISSNDIGHLVEKETVDVSKYNNLPHNNQSFYNNKSNEYLKFVIDYYNIVKNRLNVIDKEQNIQLTNIINDFSKPFYISHYNLDIMTFKKIENMLNQFLRPILNKLSVKKEWNLWDEATVRLIFIIINICYKEAKLKCDIDSFHMLESVIVEKCKEAIELCDNKSNEVPFMEQEAVDFINNAESVLIISEKDYNNSENRKIIKKQILNWMN